MIQINNSDKRIQELKREIHNRIENFHNGNKKHIQELKREINIAFYNNACIITPLFKPNLNLESIF